MAVTRQPLAILKRENAEIIKGKEIQNRSPWFWEAKPLSLNLVASRHNSMKTVAKIHMEST
jgi:hypothetical protein